MIDMLDAPEDYVRWFVGWGLKKNMPALNLEPRKIIALELVEKISSSLSYESWAAISTLEKIMDYLNYESQRAVVLKMVENLTSSGEYVRNCTVRAFISITPKLKKEVLPDLGKELLGKYDTHESSIIKALNIVIERIIPLLEDNFLKEKLEEKIRINGAQESIPVSG